MTFSHLLISAAGQATPAAAPGPGGIEPLFLIAVIFLLFYFIILRPQTKQRKKEAAERESVKKGDKVVMIGGEHGVITAVDQNEGTVTLEVDKNVRIRYAKNAISSIISPDVPKGEVANDAKK